jgi:hypothetical protein
MTVAMALRRLAGYFAALHRHVRWHAEIDGCHPAVLVLKVGIAAKMLSAKEAGRLQPPGVFPELPR